MTSSLLNHLKDAEEHHLITHLRQNAKNEIRKILTIDPEKMEGTRKARVLQSFANKKIAAILRADLEKNYSEEIARSAFNNDEYQAVASNGLTVIKGKAIYAAAEIIS